jgi:hypothetical protein
MTKRTFFNHFPPRSHPNPAAPPSQGRRGSDNRAIIIDILWNVDHLIRVSVFVNVPQPNWAATPHVDDVYSRMDRLARRNEKVGSQIVISNFS